MAASNKRPVYKIAQPIFDNQNLAESRASEGLSDASKQVYSTGAERGLTSSLGAILKGGGSVNNISEIYDTYQGGVSKLALIDEEVRARNIQNMIAQNNIMAAEQDKAFQINEYAPYADKAQAAAKLSEDGSKNISNAINTIGSAAASYGMQKLYTKDLKDIFGKTTPPATNYGEPAQLISSAIDPSSPQSSLSTLKIPASVSNYKSKFSPEQIQAIKNGTPEQIAAFLEQLTQDRNNDLMK